jgi:uncharacterized membrane protein YgcG
MAVLTVGPGQTYSTIAAAVAASDSGDTINVQGGPGIVYNDDFIYIDHTLTLQAVGGEVVMTADQPALAGKAIIIAGTPTGSPNIAINGFDISGAFVADNNGAAIRYEGGNLSLTNDYFHDNQEGLLGNGDDPNGTISVHHSEFAFNGDGSGFTHNFYAGAIANVTIDDSYFHDAIVGHEIKSRAANTSVTNSRVFDNKTDASYSIDTPNGGNVNISNNVIEQGPNSENNAIFAWGEEGNSNGGAETISNNTIVNDRAGGFGVLGGPATLTNNQLWDLTNLGNASGSGNVNLAARPSLDTSSLAFINPASGGGGTDGGGGSTGGSGGGSGGTVDGGGNPPPPALSLDDYHAQVLADFMSYFTTHPSVITNQQALGVFVAEYTSPTVLLTPPPGDLWSPTS